jgi:hypothetical protein
MMYELFDSQCLWGTSVTGLEMAWVRTAEGLRMHWTRAGEEPLPAVVEIDAERHTQPAAAA